MNKYMTGIGWPWEWDEAPAPVVNRSSTKVVYKYRKPRTTKTQVKCDVCGSTAIDHTEASCSLNRTLRRANAVPKRKLVKVMEVASLELCKELYELSAWEETAWQWLEDADEGLVLASADHWKQSDKQICPAYDCGFLLRKLPNHQKRKLKGRSSRIYYLTVVAGHSTGSWIAGYHRIDNRRSESIAYWWGNPNIITGTAGTPENALVKLCCELIRQGIIKP